MRLDFWSQTKFNGVYDSIMKSPETPMATEVPHRHTLRVPIFIGTKDDITKGVPALAKHFKGHFTKVEDGWEVTNVSPALIDQVKEVFMQDKIKLTEEFEMNMMYFLGWVVARRFTTLHISESEPTANIKMVPWRLEPVLTEVKDDHTS